MLYTYTAVHVRLDFWFLYFALCLYEIEDIQEDIQNYIQEDI